MDYKQLYLFLEGPDDERFFNKIILPHFNNFDHVKIIKYAGLKKEIINNYIKTFNTQESSDYLFFADMDARGDSSYCITKKKEKIKSNYCNILDERKTFIVKEEIESWYVSGISEKLMNQHKIKEVQDTETFTKEMFENLLSKGISKTEFMIRILEDYIHEKALSKSLSFNYLFTKIKVG